MIMSKNRKRNFDVESDYYAGFRNQGRPTFRDIGKCVECDTLLPIVQDGMCAGCIHEQQLAKINSGQNPHSGSMPGESCTSSDSTSIAYD